MCKLCRYQIANDTPKRKTPAMKKVLPLFAFAIITTLSHAQQTSSIGHAVSLTLTNSIELAFLQGSNGANLTFSSLDNYLNGVTYSNAATLKVRSNKGYTVSVRAATDHFSSSTNTQMPVNNVLFVKETNQNGFVSINTSDQTLLPGQNRGNNDFTVTYKASPGYNYEGGVYTINIIYTATQE
jgi:hypothetical protein